MRLQQLAEVAVLRGLEFAAVANITSTRFGGGQQAVGGSQDVLENVLEDMLEDVLEGVEDTMKLRHARIWRA